MKKFTKNLFTNQYNLEETFTTSLPYSLGSALVLANRFSHSSNFLNYCRCTNIEENNNNNISSNNGTSTIIEKKYTMLKNVAEEKGMIDVHLFAWKLKRKPSTVQGWYKIITNFAFSSILNHFYVNDLIDFETVKYEIEFADVKKTVETVLKTMGCENKNEVLTYFSKEFSPYFEEVVESIKNDRYDLNKVRSWFSNVKNSDGEMFLVNNENIDYSDEEVDHQRFELDIHVYGQKREQAWKTITDKICGEYCLYFPNKIKKMLKKWYNNKEMKSKDKKYQLEQWIGKWFDVEANWTKIQKNIFKIEDESEESAFKCSLMIGQWIHDYMEPQMPTMSGWVNKESVSNKNVDLFDTIVEEAIKETENVYENPGYYVKETYEEAQKALEEKRNNEWKDIVTPDSNDPDFWSKL